MVQYLRLYTGADGQTHFSDQLFPLETIEGLLMSSPPVEATHYQVRVVPSGWERDWGPAVHPILAIYLSGEGEIEASDGEVRKLAPGLVLLAEDTSGPGHAARVTGAKPVTVIQIHLPKHHPIQIG